jgi:hypothetical protein
MTNFNPVSTRPGTNPGPPAGHRLQSRSGQFYQSLNSRQVPLKIKEKNAVVTNIFC